jgi:predicted nucleotidyltransferase
MREEDIFDLEAIIKILAGKFDEIQSIYIFGSRHFETGSTRSDIDI